MNTVRSILKKLVAQMKVPSKLLSEGAHTMAQGIHF